MKKILATILAAALGLGAWAADPVTIQDAGGNNISVYEVSSGFYQSGTTYNNSTDFYITNLNGLKFFRDFVNGETAASYAYFTATGVTGTYPTTPAGIKSFHSNNMFSGKTVHLCEDIDLAGEQWVSIGFNRAERTITDPDTSASASVSKCTFYGLFDAGIYDGEGNLTGTHVISNLDTSWQYVPEAATLQAKYQLTGLFGQLSGGTTAGVKNLTVRNATVVGRDDVGVIAGRSYNGGAKIENCHVVGNVNVSGTGTYIGGLVGECRASIVNSSVDAAAGSSISGLAYVGGLAGSVFQYNANDSVEVSNSTVSQTAVSASYSGVAGVGALVGVTNPSGTYNGNVVISGNDANNVPVSAPNSSASKGGVGTLVGNALYDDGAYAIVADNTVSGTTSATAGGEAVTVKMGAANDNIVVGANVTFDENGQVTGGIFEVINEEVIAPGYVSTDNPDTTTSTAYPLTIGGPYVALIGTTPYSSLADAVAAVPENGSEATTITMSADTELSATVMIPANKNIVLDLNGKTITTAYNGDPSGGRHYYAIDNYGTFTLNDSSNPSTGAIVARGIENFESGTMTINGGTITACDANGGSPLWIVGGNVEFNGGTLLSSAGSKYAVHIEAATVAVNDITVSGSNWNGVFYTVDSNLTVEDADIDIICAYYVFYVDKGSTVTVNGGTYKKTGTNWESMICVGTEPSATVNTNTLTINDGTFGLAPPADKQEVNPLILQWVDGGYARIVINGGTIIGTSQNLYKLHSGLQNSPEYAEVYITAGTFYTGKGVTAEVPSGTSATIAPGSVLSEQLTDGNGKTYYTVVPPNYVAQVISVDGATTNKYDTVDAALKAVETLAGATVNIFAGDYTLTTTKYKFADDVTIVGATDSEGNNLVTLNNSLTINDASLYTTGAKNLTLKNLNVSAPSGATALTRCGFEGNTVIEHCTLSGKNGVQNCYVKNGGNVAFKDCVATGTTYGIHFGGASGTISIDGCTITGWTSFDGSITKLDLANTRFEDGNYDYLRFYQDAVISNCTFNANMKVNEKSSGKSLIVIDSSVDGKAMASIITEGDDDLPVENNYVAVGTGVELDENGYITGGLFERVDDALIAPECVTGSNSDGETSVTYPTAVGLLRVTDIEPQPGATEMKATYAVTAVVVNDEGETIGIFASQQMIEVSIAAADVAGSTLAKYDVSKVLDAALASGGLNVTKVEISVVISAPTSGEGTVSYEVHPEAVVTVTEDATDTTTTIPLSNACLAADASFTFDLDVTGVVEARGWAKVTHVSADPNYAAEARNLKAFAGDGGKVYVTVTTTHFSTFTVEAGVLPVTFGVRSDNLFGSIKIEGNVASNLYVAVPFEGFEADGALRKAQDVVHATNLTAGTKMYVYDKNADKYDVFEVDANGKWAAALKINVTEMTNTFDTADLMRGVTNGTGVIVGRKNTAETVYVYGQVPKIPIASTTFGAGQTLVSPPYTNGVEYVDLNASTWTGVSATTKKRLKGQAGADYIQFRAPNNKLVKYYYLEGEGWGVVPTQVSLFSEFVANGKALIPVGTAFWYYSNAGGAKVEWK